MEEDYDDSSMPSPAASHRSHGASPAWGAPSYTLDPQCLRQKGAVVELSTPCPLPTACSVSRALYVHKY